MKDITFERDQLDRADRPRTCRHGYIPVADEPCPQCSDPFWRLVAGGCSREEAAAIVDAGFMNRRQYAQHYEEAA